MIYMWNNMVNKTKNKVKIFMQNKNNRTIVTIALIIVCFFAFNLSGLLSNVFTSLANLFTNVDGEIKELVIESEGYDTEGGSYKITKKGNWSSSTEVELEYELESIAEDNGVNKDVILVLDISKSMEGTRIDELKSSTSDLVKTLLSKNDNKVGIVSFSTSAKVESNLTNDETVLLNAIEGLTPSGDTSYYQALLKLEELLVGYQEEANRELVVIFITDGYPNIDTSNEKAQYKLLKDKYSAMIIYGIGFEIDSSMSVIKNISDYQYSTSSNLNLDEILKEAALSPEYYETFQVEETINNEYFDVKEEDITVSIGDAEIIEENGAQKIVWTSDGDVRSGSTQKMTIKLTVKDGKQNTEGLWNISTLTEADLILLNKVSHRLSSTESLKLKSGYKVKYEANAPAGCNAEIDLEETHYAYENVRLTAQNLECDGYQFGGWEVVEEALTINDDVFQMPTYNVTVKGIWKQLSIDKTMDGEVYERLTLYKAIAKQAQLDTNIDFSKVNGTTNGNGVYTVESTKDDTNPIHYFRGNVNNNNVIFGGYCWKIVRTTETGGIKIVYNGTPVGGKCTNTTGTATQIGTSAFNSSYNSPAYVGYMYGTVYSYGRKTFTSVDSANNYLYGNDVTYTNGEYTLVDTKQFWDWSNNYNKINDNHYTCFATDGKCTSVYYIYYTTDSYAHYITLKDGKKVEDALDEMLNNNITDSTIKTEVDNWYASNMTSYTSYLEDTKWCNDRSVYYLGGWNPNGGLTSDYLSFNPNERSIKIYKPSLECRNIDAFTLNVESGGIAGYGNNKLDYPVGLLTIDELMYAGASVNTYNSNYYLYTNQYYWVMSSSHLDINNVGEFLVYPSGILRNFAVDFLYGVRPAVSLKPDTEYTTGDGTPDNPYVIKLEQ